MIKLICGASHVGKTTFSQRFKNDVHLDDVAQKPTERYAAVNDIVRRTSGDVVVEGIYESPEQRIALLNAYNGEGRECIFLDPSEEEINSRPFAKRHGWVKKHSFTPPDYTEGWDRIEVIHHG